MNRKISPVTILTSSVGLGVYIPALLIERQLSDLGYVADVEVLENYYTPEQQRAHLAYRDAHHDSFALAQMAHRMVRDVQPSLDRSRFEPLLTRWADENRDRFIVWSGFWLPLIEQYRNLRRDVRLYIDHCRIDAEISASFKIYPQLQESGTVIWLWNWAERRIVHEVPVTPEAPLPFSSRDDRLAVHGGGWNIGTYQDRTSELNEAGYGLNVVIHHPDETRRNAASDRLYTLEPDWRPWKKTPDGVHEFPPMGEVLGSGETAYRRNRNYHMFHDIIRHSRGIVSKPGGCTLIDSLSSATPVVLLEPYGYAEKSNALIWEHLGFGIPYEKWKATGYDMAVLHKLHLNILARAKTGIDYSRAYAARLAQS